MKFKKNHSKTIRSRRAFMKESACLVAGISSPMPGKLISDHLSVGNSSEETATSEQNEKNRIVNRRQPNILIIIPDHARADSLNLENQCLTPNLDQLASEGVQFTRCYTPTGMCSPARASIMTGTYASTHGLWDCTHTQRKEWVDVSPRLTQWAQRLSESGCQTGYFGKWHASQNKYLEGFGWQEYEIKDSTIMKGKYIKGTEVISCKTGYKDYLLAAVRHDIKDIPHHPAFDLGIDFIQRHSSKDKPFCCCVSTREPGENIPPKKYIDMYDVNKTKLSQTLRDDLKGKSEILHRMQAVWKDLNDSDWRKITTCNFAEMTFIDSEIGRILQTLHDTGCYENTIVIYMSDHGQMLGAHGLVGLGLGLPYEEVYNIPLIIRLPDWLSDTTVNRKGRKVSDALISSVDIYPTLLELCGIESLPHTQGRSLMPLIDGTADLSDWQEAYGEFFGQRFMYSQRIVWNGNWKYVFTPGGIDELYNLAKDPLEEKNLANNNEYRGILVDMVKRMWRKMEQIGDESLLNTDYATLRTAPIGPRN
jgi:arylsulfatase A-like enzyme